MTIRKIKVSALPTATSFVGLNVLGIDSLNNSVKAPMSVLQGNSAYQSWLAQPGNAGKTEAEFVEWIRSTAAADAAAALASKNAAAVSEANALASKNAAATSETNALASENAAATDAATATAQATIATTKAGEALASKNAAATSETNALASKNAAAVSETNAAASAATVNSFLPTALDLTYNARITKGNNIAQKITATLTPSNPRGNVLFLGDNLAVNVFPDGGFVINRVGQSKVHCIPTDNTSIYQTITIDVVEPVMRKVTATSIRFLANGMIRLT